MREVCSTLHLHHTDRSPMSLSQYYSLGEYCGPHTASSVFLILLVSPYEGSYSPAIVEDGKEFEVVPVPVF